MGPRLALEQAPVRAWVSCSVHTGRPASGQHFTVPEAVDGLQKEPPSLSPRLEAVQARGRAWPCAGPRGWPELFSHSDFTWRKLPKYTVQNPRASWSGLFSGREQSPARPPAAAPPPPQSVLPQQDRGHCRSQSTGAASRGAVPRAELPVGRARCPAPVVPVHAAACSRADLPVRSQWTGCKEAGR